MLNPGDVHPGYVEGLNDPEVNRYLVGVKCRKQTAQSVSDFVAADARTTDAILFGIWQTESQLHVGTVRIHSIDRQHGTANIGVCLFNKAAWGQGLGAKAIRAATGWAFEALKLRWIEAGAYAENVSSQRAFSAAGYRWLHDVSEKYLFEGRPATVKFYVARPETFFIS